LATQPTILVAPADNVMALAVIRSLGRQGLKTVGITRNSQGLGRQSRYCLNCVPVSDSPSETIETILSLAARYHASHLIATNEIFIVLLNEHRSLLEAHLQLLFPPPNLFDLALHKDKTLRIARAVGVPTPRTEVIESIDDLPRCAGMRFPVVLKPPHGDIRSPLTFKALYVDSYEELCEEILRFGALGQYPLVQEYWQGTGVGVEVLMRRSSPLMLFQHRRIHEYPITGGASVYCESMPLNPKLVDYSVTLLKAMGWDGVAMVEFKFDEKTGEAALMEVNGRFWGSLPLALHAGADFPYVFYLSSLDGHALPKFQSRAVRCRSLAGDTKWLIGTLRDGKAPKLRAMMDYLTAFRPGVRYFIWAIDDPMPAVYQFVRRVLTAILRAVRLPLAAILRQRSTT